MALCWRSATVLGSLKSGYRYRMLLTLIYFKAFHSCCLYQNKKHVIKYITINPCYSLVSLFRKEKRFRHDIGSNPYFKKKLLKLFTVVTNKYWVYFQTKNSFTRAPIGQIWDNLSLKKNLWVHNDTSKNNNNNNKQVKAKASSYRKILAN